MFSGTDQNCSLSTTGQVLLRLSVGIAIVVLFFKERKDSYFKWMWLAVLMKFAFYPPAVLWADVHQWQQAHLQWLQLLWQM